MSSHSSGALGRFYHLIMSTCGAIGALLFGLMSVIVTLDVVFRNIDIDLIPASVEITEYMLMVATFLAAPWLLYKGGHIRIDVLVNYASAGVQRFLFIVCNLLGTAVCAVLAYESLLVLLDLHRQQSLVFKELIFPEWWLSLPLLISASLLSLEFLRRLALDFTKR